MERRGGPLTEAGSRGVEHRGDPWARFPPQRYIDYPPDLASKEELRRLLSETDVFGPATDEAKAYLDCALERFRITMAVLPPLGPDARVLELGANPYFLTRLLRWRGVDVRAANWFGENSGFGSEGLQRVVESGIPHEYRFDHFNVEAERFPYADGSFDLVLFCEILEHLPTDPTHTLVEIHRVLRPGGKMVLTTPNASRLENLNKSQRGENTYEQLSGYGVYGRHNREYTVAELEDLLAGCGYIVDDIFARDIWLEPELPVLADGISLEHRGENLFVVATAGRQRRWYYPDWLYQSVHGYRRAVQPDLVVGVNCDLQASGLHKLEDFGDRLGRWTIGGAEATVIVAPGPGGWARLRIEGRTPDIGGMITISAEAEQQRFSWRVPCDGNPFALEHGIRTRAGEQTVKIWSDRAWRPCDQGDSLDARVLGFVLHAVAIEPQPCEPVRRDVVVGANCTNQLAGVHHLEEIDGEAFRWTDGEADTVARVLPETGGAAVLEIEGWAPAIDGDVEIRAVVGERSFSWTIPADGHRFAVTAALEVGEDEEVRLSTDRPWRPSDVNGTPDGRTLGFMLKRVTIRPRVSRTDELASLVNRPVRWARRILSPD